MSDTSNDNANLREERFVLITTIALLLLVSSCGSRQSSAPSSAESPRQTQAESLPSPTPEKPSFEGQIEHVSMYPVPNRREDLAVTLIVSVRNSGEPRLAANWRLEVNSAGRKIPAILEPIHISGYVELPGTSGPKVDLAKEDLVTKTAQSSIPKGSSVKGVLTFVLSKTSESEVANNNTTFTVNFKDSQGNSYITRKYLIGSKVKDARGK